MKDFLGKICSKTALSNVIRGVLICIALSGCENFLGDVNLKQQLAEDIDYAKAKSITILIQADEGTGTVVPAGNYTAKRGYPFEISFTEAAGYSFNGWKAVPADDAETLPENAVVFDDPNSIKTNVTVNADISNIKIVPGCDDRIAVKEKSPLLGNTVSRNSSIVVVFSKEPDKQSFIFSEDEIPEGAETVKNDDEEIYAYVHEGETKFKNIQITINDISIAQHYLQPQVEGKTLVINANPARLIEFDQAGSSKIISVTLSDKIFDKDNVSMNKTENWKFTVNEETNEKARIELTSNAEEGAVYLAGTRDYSMGQKITLSFTENADYQFLNWQYDNNIVTVDDPYSSDTFAFVKAESNATQIKAVCAPRLRVTEVSPLSGESVSKNTPIEITFNKDLPVDDKGLLQLENISITIGGSPVRTSFKTPEVSNNKITFTADMQNLLDVPAGQTKTVTVTVPADFYYQLDDENKTKVYYGGNGKTFSYRINETTSQKAYITFSASEGSGTIVKNADSSLGYSIGQEVDISFEPADDTWQFDGWTVDVEESKIEIKDKTAIKTVLRINEAPLTATVKAKVSKKLVAQLSGLNLDSPNPKDSQIKIVFNKELDPACADSKILKKIKISTEGNSLDSYYTDRSLSGNTITIKNTSYISVPNESTKIISVAVPEDFYYTNEGTKVFLKEQNFSFSIDYTTVTKNTVRFVTDDAAVPGKQISVDGAYLSSGTKQVMYLDQMFELAYPVSEGYKFAGWKIVAANENYTVTTDDYVTNGIINVENDKTCFTLTIDSENPARAVVRSYDAIGNGTGGWGVTVLAKDVLLPKIISIAPDYSTDGIECDSPIEIEFNKDINPSTVSFSSTGTIQIVNPSNEKEHYEKYFNNPVWNGNTLTIKPKSQDTYADNGNNNNDAIRRLFSRTNDLINLEVKIDYNQIKDISGNLLQKNDSLWVYRIKYAMETVAPEVDITLKKPIYQLEKYMLQDGTFDYRSKESGSYKSLSDEQFTAFTSATFPQNHIGTKVYFTATASDSGSGYKGLTIKETMIRTVSGDTVKQECEPINYGSTRTEFTDEEYILQSNEDGVIQLDFIFEDYAGNNTTKTYYVIRDTKMDSSKALKRQFSGYYTINVENDGTETGNYTNSYCYSKITPQNILRSFFDTNGIMTENFNFSDCTDKYYSNYNSGGNNSSTIMYVLDYGYSMNEMLTQGQSGFISDNQSSYSVQRDVTKDLVVRITAMDDSGNIKNIIRVIPGKVNLSLMTQAGKYGYFHLDNIHKFDNNVTEYGARRFDYTYVYTYQANEDAEPTEFRTKVTTGLNDISKNGRGVHDDSDRIPIHSLHGVADEDYFPDGIYKFYILPCYCYSELNYFGCFSEPYTYYHNYTPSNTGTSNETSPNFPESYTFSDIEHPLNTGYTTAKVKLPDDFTMSPNFVYGIKYKQKNSSEQYEYAELEFVVPSGYIYDTALYAKKSNGTIFDSEQQAPVELDATYDNIPPYVDVSNVWVTKKSSAPNIIYLYDTSAGGSYAPFPSDKGSAGIFINTEGKREFDYYLIKKANTGTLYTDQITRADLLNYTKHTIAYSEGRTYLWLDWDSFIEGNYILVMDLKDNNQNSALYSYVVVNVTTPEIPETWVDTENNNLHVKALSSHNSYNGYINRLEGNEWSSSSRYEGQYMGNSGIVDRAYGFKFSDTKKDYFTRCSVHNGDSDTFIHSLYAYVCPGYYMKKAENESFECSSKAVISGLGGAYQVYYDGPCFAHTMAFPTERLDDLAAKLTEAKSIAQKNNQTIDEETYIKAIWETKGREYGLKLINSEWLTSASTVTYTAPVSEIPAGFSYVTIFHFADGTSVMSEVKQK